MRDEDKTKEQLIRELQGLRQRSDNVDTELEINEEILKHVSEGVLLIQPDTGNIVFTTQSLNQMSGYDPTELIGQHVNKLIAYDDVTTETIFNNIINSLKKSGTWRGDIYNQAKDGTVFWTLNKVSTFKHAIYGTVWIIVQEDISKYKTVEKAFRENEELLTNIIESISEGILVLDRNFQYTLQMVLVDLQ